jgi:acetyl-CoA C-acetyltransferase
MKEVVITGAARTAAGSFLGALADIPAPKLGAIAIAARRASSRESPFRQGQ